MNFFHQSSQQGNNLIVDLPGATLNFLSYHVTFVVYILVVFFMLLLMQGCEAKLIYFSSPIKMDLALNVKGNS